MSAKLFTGTFLALGVLLIGAVAANEQAKDCCSLKLACCNPKSACCEADAKLGCCEMGLKCCTENKGCCTAVQKCCKDAKACCGPTKAVVTKTSSCCSLKGVAKQEDKAADKKEAKACRELPHKKV